MTTESTKTSGILGRHSSTVVSWVEILHNQDHRLMNFVVNFIFMALSHRQCHASVEMTGLLLWRSSRIRWVNT